MKEKMKIYVASSWRNEQQSSVVDALREAGFEVYDFKNPEPGDNGFGWSQIDPDWQQWSPEKFADTVMNHPVAKSGFDKDMRALYSCQMCVLVMPCGRSAHLEAGWCIGSGRPTAILLSDGEPELMYRMADKLTHSIDETVQWCRWVENYTNFRQQVREILGTYPIADDNDGTCTGWADDYPDDGWEERFNGGDEPSDVARDEWDSILASQ